MDQARAGLDGPVERVPGAVPFELPRAVQLALPISESHGKKENKKTEH